MVPNYTENVEILRKITIKYVFVEAIYSNQLTDVVKMAKSNFWYQITIFYSEWSDELENSIKALDDLTNVSRQFIFISTIMKNKEENIRFVKSLKYMPWQMAKHGPKRTIKVSKAFKS